MAWYYIKIKTINKIKFSEAYVIYNTQGARLLFKLQLVVILIKIFTFN